MKENTMMNKTIVMMLAAVSVATAFGGLRIRWDFEKTDEKGNVVNVAADGARIPPLGGVAIRPGEGVDGSAAAFVEKGATPQSAYVKLDYEAFTLDMRFALTGPVGSKHGVGLASYSWAPWKRGNFLLRITRDSRLEARFTRQAAKDGSFGKVEFSAISEPLRFAANVFHAVRVTCDAKGDLKLYCDGTLVAEKPGAPGLKGIEYPSPEWYPLIRFGAIDDDTQNFVGVLNGFIDDIEIYDEALGPQEIKVENVDYSGIAPVEYKAGIPQTDDILVPDANGFARTGKFRINEREEGALGHWVRAEEKFVRNASTATLKIDGDFVTAVITCPVPEGMEVKKSDTAIWRGDEVEFFVRPNVNEDRVYQYLVNASGLSQALCHLPGGVSDKSYRSAFKATVKDLPNGFEVTIAVPRREIFAELPKDGDVFSVNFARCGATCGGVSTWANVGKKLHNPGKFGKVLVGGSKAYFAKRLAAAKAEVAAHTGKAGDAAAKAYAPLAAAVAEHAFDPAAYASLERIFTDFRQTMIAISLAGTPLMVFRPDDPWGNAVEPTAESKPLSRIRIAAARNSKAWYSFAVKNMTDREFLGQVKVFDKGPGCKFGFEGTKGAARHFKVMEAIPADIGGGTLSYDPFAELPMGTLLRIAPKGAAMLWLELDTHGLAAGKHFGKLVIKKARAGFETVSVPVEMMIVDADLDTVRTDRANYDYFGRNTESLEFNRFAAEKIGNVIGTGAPVGLFARKRKDGTWAPGNFEALDRKIEARIRGGVPKDRLVLWTWLSLGLQYCWNAPKGVNGAVLKANDPDWKEGLKATVDAIFTHVKEKYGFDYDRVIFYTQDEPVANEPINPDGKIDNSLSMAYYSAKAIKEANPKYRTFTNPHTFGGAYDVGKFCEALKRLEECYDIIEFYRPNVTPELVVHLKEFKFEYWTYNIIGTTTPPSTYCGDVWRNMRDGFRELTPFWHFEEMAGFDGFDPSDTSDPAGRNYSDYGAAYVDYDLGKTLTSRRLTAYELGCEDSRLIRFLRAKFAADPSKLAEVEKIVKTAADKGTMAALENGRNSLFRLAAGK